MRVIWILSLLLLALTTLGVAQSDKDTSFASGPQYLITNGSPMLLHPISTPSLTLGQAPAQDPYIDATELAPAPAAPDNTFLGSVYWGDHPDSEIAGRRLSPPSMTPSETAWYMGEVTRAAGANQSALSNQVEAPASGVIEITSTQLPAHLPPSILDLGVTGTADATSLHERGYGQPLGDVAAYWKTHKGHAAHTYTNSDLDRLHGG